MKRVLPYIIAFAVGALTVTIVICAMGVWNAKNTAEVLQILCDAFFAAGILVFGAGLLVVCSNGGAFYMLAYGIIRFFDLFKRNAKGKYKDFYEYTEIKKQNKRGFGFLLIVGAVYLAVSIALLIAFNNV